MRHASLRVAFGALSLRGLAAQPTTTVPLSSGTTYVHHTDVAFTYMGELAAPSVVLLRGRTRPAALMDARRTP